MDLRHARSGAIGPIAAVALLAATAALSCAPSVDATREAEAEVEAELAADPRPPSASASPSSFTLFESGQVRPLAISPDSKHLFAVNTPDNRLEVFRIKKRGLDHVTSIPVGLEPVAVAVRNDREVWVVNHLSDSVSIVELDSNEKSGRVIRTLLVGDEPRDIVFAGPQRKRAFITTAHRGQNIPFDPKLTTPGVGRADVWVFDATALGGNPLTIVTLFTDTPRALAVTPDGSKVYAAGFHTGNQTTTVGEPQITGIGLAGVAGPSTNHQLIAAPTVGEVVKWNGAHWVNTIGTVRDDFVKFSLPDKDVFVLDAMANPPRQLAGPNGFFQHVGTILYSMVVNPANGKVYVANTDANNAERFEGPGSFAGHSLRGHLHESRITVLGPGGSGGSVAPRHLNKHINFNACCAPVPNPENAKSLALPQGMAVSHDGDTLYVAALGSDKVGVFDTKQLENNTFTPSTANQIHVSGGGPTGVVLDDDRDQLFVLTRFDDAISILDTRTRTEVAHVAMHNPEPPSITVGRRFLYDAQFSSSHGDSSCASCHAFGDFDSLAWDLGNPDDDVTDDPGPFVSSLRNLFVPTQFLPKTFHPMKGPMTTQSLRGMANHGPMHWRGDRTGGNTAPNAQPDSGAFDERAAFQKFQLGFTDLLGRSAPIPPAAMTAFTDFILQVTYPPNPNRPLDNTFTADQEIGRQLFTGTNCGIKNPDETKDLICTSCHLIDPTANPTTAKPGFFGSSGLTSFDFQTQLFKTPHLRNAYQKLGMFGNAFNPGFPNVDTSFQGDQVRGFGFLHDGNMDTVFRFHHGISFADTSSAPPGTPPGFLDGPAGEVQRRQVEDFILAFPTNLAPVVGQQVTFTAGASAAVRARADLLRQRADAGECDLVAKTDAGDDEAGFLYIGAGKFRPDRKAVPPISDAALRAMASSGHPVTFTCAPPGSGVRIGVDRDGDGFWDGDERDAHSDPADASDTP